MLYGTVGYEGVDLKKSRIQLKIASFTEGKETAHPAQESSDAISGKGKAEQEKAIIKVKRKLTNEDISTQEKRKKTAEEAPPRASSPTDLSVQANVGTEMSEDYPLRIEKSAG